MGFNGIIGINDLWDTIDTKRLKVLIWNDDLTKTRGGLSQKKTVISHDLTRFNQEKHGVYLLDCHFTIR